jgi:hypothetical protein
VCLFCAVSLRAQQSGSGSGGSAGAAVDSPPASGVAATPGAVPHLIKFSGVINPKTSPQIAQITQTKENENGKSPSPAVVDVTFSLYQLQEGGSALWSESQQVQLDSQGRYSVLLGATMPEGLPLDLFTSGEALWLGVEPQAPGATEQPRVLLVAVPYALKAVDADTLGGKPASAYLSVDNPSATPQGGGLAAAASAAAGSGSGKGEAEKKQRSTSPSGSGTANYVPLWLDNNGTLGNSVFYQASNGNMGLGTTSPQQVLHVNGANEILSTGTGAGFKFQMRDSKTTSVWYGSGNVSRFWRSDYGDVLGITGAGQVGIGTTKPGSPLEVDGKTTSQVVSVSQTGNGNGLVASTSGSGAGVMGLSTGSEGFGVLGESSGLVAGVFINTGGGDLIDADTSLSHCESHCLFTLSSAGNLTTAGNAIIGGGVTAASATFSGNVNVNGDLNVQGTKHFKIDDPLDPDHKFLYHASVESSEIMNIYTGNVTTDAHGNAVVELPAWFQALNRDFRYQLTVIGQFAQATVAQEIESNRFTIKTDKADVKVSWQVTGVRHDAYAQAHPLQVEVDKPERAQ